MSDQEPVSQGSLTTNATSSPQESTPKSEVGSGSDANKPDQDGGSILHRRSRWESSLAAIKYISTISKDDEIQVRDSDRATSIALLLMSILSAVSLLVPALSKHIVALILGCDVLVGVSMIMYLANRFGIVGTLNPRQALLTWQLMMGSLFLGVFLTINLAGIILVSVSSTPPITVGPF